MNITGVIVDLLIKMAPEVYGPYVIFENGIKVLCVQVLRSLYVILIAALLWYKEFKLDIWETGIQIEPLWLKGCK